MIGNLGKPTQKVFEVTIFIPTFTNTLMSL